MKSHYSFYSDGDIKYRYLRNSFYNYDSFNKLIPNWELNVSTVAEPSRDKVRLLAILKLLYLYGGMLVPSSFLCLRSLDSLYQNTIHSPFIISNLDKTSNPDRDFLPDPTFIGCGKTDDCIKEFIQFHIQKQVM